MLCVVKWLDGWKEVPSWQNAKKNETLSDSTATFIKTAAPNKRLKDVFETVSLVFKTVNFITCVILHVYFYIYVCLHVYGICFSYKLSRHY